MKATNININKSIQATSVLLVHRLSQKYHCQNEDALKMLLKTITYSLLQDRNTGLYAESSEHVWNMLLDEEAGNLESWMHE